MSGCLVECTVAECGSVEDESNLVGEGCLQRWLERLLRKVELNT